MKHIPKLDTLFQEVFIQFKKFQQEQLESTNDSNTAKLLKIFDAEVQQDDPDANFINYDVFTFLILLDPSLYIMLNDQKIAQNEKTRLTHNQIVDYLFQHTPKTVIVERHVTQYLVWRMSNLLNDFASDILNSIHTVTSNHLNEITFDEVLAFTNTMIRADGIADESETNAYFYIKKYLTKDISFSELKEYLLKFPHKLEDCTIEELPA